MTFTGAFPFFGSMGFFFYRKRAAAHGANRAKRGTGLCADRNNDSYTSG